MSIHVKEDYINKGEGWVNYVTHFKIPESNFTPIPEDNKCTICGMPLNKHNHCVICKVKYGEIKNIKKYISIGTYASDDINDIFLSRTILIEKSFCRHCGSQDLYSPKKFYFEINESNFDRLLMFDINFKEFVLDANANRILTSRNIKKVTNNLKTQDRDIIFNYSLGHCAMCQSCNRLSNAVSHIVDSIHNFEKIKRFNELKSVSKTFIPLFCKSTFKRPSHFSLSSILNKIVDVHILSYLLNPEIAEYCENRFKNDEKYNMVKTKLNELLNSKLHKLS